MSAEVADVHALAVFQMKTSRSNKRTAQSAEATYTALIRARRSMAWRSSTGCSPATAPAGHGECSSKQKCQIPDLWFQA